ncbi:MAG TPA: histidine phosphatase family protein [Acidimicrobiales bacterium]|nr:histidine phosphatase family protein [Acidimicrobiales bacterium]
MAPTDILFLRHAESTWNAARRSQGWADAPLSEAGRAACLEVARALRPLAVTALVSSDLTRARTTAELLGAELGAPVAHDARLREREMGWWTGLTSAAIEHEWAETLAAWRAGRLDRPPGGEYNPFVVTRVTAAIAAIAAGDHPGRSAGPVLVVSHGGVLSLLERRAGVERSSGANLAGRWLRVDGDRVEVGVEWSG